MSETEVQEPLSEVEETVVPTESVPEAPEAASTGAEPVLTDAPASDRPRDANGRFMKRDGTPVAPDEQAALEAAASAIPATEPPAPTQPIGFTGDPFVFRAEGQKIPLTGAVVDKDGWLHIPPDQQPMTRQLLAEGVAHRGSWRQREADWQRQVSEAGAVEKARADKYNAAAVFLFDRINDPNWLQAVQQDPERELALLRRELGLELKQREIAAPRAPEAPKAEAPNQQQVEAAFTATLTEEVDELLEDPRIRGLFTPEEAEELKADFTERMAAYAAEVDGQIMLDRHAVKRAFDREVKTQQRIKQAAAEAAKARTFNEKRNAPAPALPPVVSTKGPGGSGSTTKVYTSKEEWRKAMRLD